MPQSCTLSLHAARLRQDQNQEMDGSSFKIQCLEVISLPEAASAKLVVTQGKGVVESVLKSDKHRKKRASNDPVPMGSGFKEVGLGKSLSL